MSMSIFITITYIKRARFTLNPEGAPWKILWKDIITLAQTWSVLSYFNLTPTSHTFDLNMDRALLIYVIVMKMDMDTHKHTHTEKHTHTHTPTHTHTATHTDTQTDTHTHRNTHRHT